MTEENVSELIGAIIGADAEISYRQVYFLLTEEGRYFNCLVGDTLSTTKDIYEATSYSNEKEAEDMVNYIEYKKLSSTPLKIVSYLETRIYRPLRES